MRSTFEIRLACSLKALGIVWVASGIAFTIVVKGPSTIQAWVIWGTGPFVIGWIVVGLPLIALGERVRRIPYVLLAILGGLGGALALVSPGIVVLLISPPAGRADFTSPIALMWEGIAVAIAAPTTVLYRLFLDRAVAKLLKK